MLRTVLLISCLISIKTVVFCADCADQACLTKLYNARVTKAEYYTRYVVIEKAILLCELIKQLKSMRNRQVTLSDYNFTVVSR